MDNTATPVADNPDTQEAPVTPETSTSATEGFTSGWKSTLNTDLRNSPLLQKFEDTPEGLNKAFESQANLEKLLGHEKVPIPKDEKDTEGWNRFSKAMGIPDKADGYGLPDPNLPESLKGFALDKGKFAEIVHAHKLTPGQAKGLWKVYNEMNVNNYNQAMAKHKEAITQNINRLKGEWGDAYDTNIELGQTVINKFSDDQEMNDYLTAALSQDPRGIKFLAKLGNEFAENKVGEFQMRRFSLAPDQAKEELDKIRRDPKHPYNDRNATDAEHDRAVQYVNSLHALIAKGKG